MKTKRINNVFAAFLLLVLSFSGCGDSSVSGIFKFSAEVSEAYTTLLEANLEKQTGMYNILSALSNDYASDFLEQLPTDLQLDAIEDELTRMAELAPNVIDAIEILETAATEYPDIVSVFLENGVSELNPLLEFFRTLMDYPDERKNEFLMVVFNMTLTQQINLYDNLPDELRARATDPYDFYRKVEDGELNDVICAIIAAVQIDVNYVSAAAAQNLTRTDVTVSRGLRMVMSGIRVMITVNVSGNGNDLVSASLKETLAAVFNRFWQNKARVLNPASDSGITDLNSATAVALAISESLNDVSDVHDADSGEIVTGDSERFEINISGQLEVTLVSASALVEEMTAAILAMGQFMSVYSFGGELPELYGAVMVGYDDGSDIEGFIVAQQTDTSAPGPQWVLGLGGGNPAWYGALPAVPWSFTVVNANGEESSSQTETVATGSSTGVTVHRKTEKIKEAPEHEATWFDWVEYGVPTDFIDIDVDGDSDADGDGGGSYDGSCDGRANPDGTCVDYFGMSYEVMNNMQNGCQGTFSSALCSTAGISFSCAMDVSGYGESYEVRAHVYNRDDIPADSRQAFCNVTCTYFPAGGDIQITNCSVQ